jgi:hypothetical protein
MKQTLNTQLHRMATDRWARNGLRLLLRACWIAVCLCCIALGGVLVWGWPLRLEWLGAAALGCIAVALLILLRPPMRPAEAARRLDRRFGLNEQLATAIEIAGTNPPPGSVGSHLVLQATRNARGLRQQLRKRQRLPWTELFTLLALCLAALGLLLLTGIGTPWFSGQAAALPPLPSVADPADLFEEPLPPDGQGEPMPGEGGEPMPGEGQGSAQSGAAGAQSQSGQGTNPADAQTLEAVANALRDQGATRPAAEALDEGDTSGAAQELRELADQAGQLSQAARDDLAGNLREAASSIGQSDPQMAEQLRESASGLEGSSREASEALDDLAQSIEAMGGAGQQGDASQSGAGQGEGQEGSQPGSGQSGQGGQGDQAGPQGNGQGSGAGNSSSGQQRAVQPERLGVDGTAVELEAEGGGQSANPQNQPGTTMPGGTGSTAGGDPQSMGAVGPDPLRIPLDERDVVQEYFNP